LRGEKRVNVPESMQNTGKKGDVRVSAFGTQNNTTAFSVARVPDLDIITLFVLNAKVGKLPPISIDSKAGAATAGSSVVNLTFPVIQNESSRI
jgi:hypothetical protein